MQGEFVSEALEATGLELAAMRHVELDPESDEEELCIEYICSGGKS
jgi:hypothetical protein